MCWQTGRRCEDFLQTDNRARLGILESHVLAQFLFADAMIRFDDDILTADAFADVGAILTTDAFIM